MVLEVVLVIVLGGIERGGWLDRGDDRAGEGALFRQLSNHLLRGLVLLLIAIKNHRAILLADVVTLAVQRCRIVHREEHLQQVFVADDGRIKGDLRHLYMPGLAAANLLVARVLHVPAHVARDYSLHALQLVERSFHAPEASAAEDRCLCHCVFLRTRYNNQPARVRKRTPQSQWDILPFRKTGTLGARTA